MEESDAPDDSLARLHVLHAPFEGGARMVQLDKAKGVIELKPLEKLGLSPSTTSYSLAVVDEAHHVYKDPSATAIALHRFEVLLLLSDASQASSDVNFPKNVTDIVELTEVVRSSKRIISAASAPFLFALLCEMYGHREVSKVEGLFGSLAAC